MFIAKFQVKETVNNNMFVFKTIFFSRKVIINHKKITEIYINSINSSLSSVSVYTNSKNKLVAKGNHQNSSSRFTDIHNFNRHYILLFNQIDR